MDILFETPRLLLRKITENDVQDMFELDSNPAVHRYLGNKPIKTQEEALQTIKDIMQQYEDHGIARLAVIERQTGDFLGWSGLKYELSLEKYSPYYDLGCRFKEPYWGKGYATETAIASLKYGFTQLNLQTINAAADVANIASNKVIQ